MTSNAWTTVFRAVNGSPSENLIHVIRLMGGIELLVGKYDMVVIKPNVQWWNQGASNLAALNAFADLVMHRPGGFSGEIVFAENCHRGPYPQGSKNSGWLRPFDRNSDIEGILNFNELARLLKQKYGTQFSLCHLIDVDQGAARVKGPADGPGYVYCDGTGGNPLISMDNGGEGDNYRAVIMSYPIFRTDRGTLVDFRQGIWAGGAYTAQPLKFINFSAFNHHSIYCGVTGAMKNYLGISDLSGGPDPHAGGRLTDDYCNFHSFPFNRWAAGPVAGMIGAEIGLFMDTIRKADLNIMTAEWIGLVSRTELPAAQTRAVLACADPVALDFHAAKYLLHPNSRLTIHDPENPHGPLYQDLIQCSRRNGGILDEERVTVRSYNCEKRALQTGKERPVKSRIRWGLNPKMLAKYLFLRLRKFTFLFQMPRILRLPRG